MTRDFEQDAVDAGRFFQRIKQTQFSWSPARRNVFERCRRAYFIHYYLAQGGWDRYAHPVIARAYLEKHLKTFPGVLNDTFTQILWEALSHTSDLRPIVRKKQFSLLFLRGLSSKIAALSHGLEDQFAGGPESGMEPDAFRLLEVEYNYPNFCKPDEIISSATDLIGHAYRAFVESPLCDEFLLLPSLAWQGKTEFIQFRVRGIPIWLHPGMLFRQGGTLHQVSFFCQFGTGEWSDDADADASAQAVLFALYGQQLPGAAPTCYRRCFYDQHSFFLREYVVSESERWGRTMEESAEAMNSLLDRNHSISLQSCPCQTNPPICQGCRYQISCRQLQTLCEQ